MSLTNWSLLILTAALFGSSFPMIGIAVAEVSPVLLAAARVLIATPFVMIFLRVTGRRLPPLGRGWIPLWILGVATAAIPYFAIAWGQTHITSSLGGILFATIPIFTALLAPLFVDETRLPFTGLLGILVAFAGVVLAIGPASLLGMGTQTLGAVVTLLAALSYALGNIFARSQVNLDPVVMAVGQLVTGSVILGVLALIFADMPTELPGAVTIGATAFVGFFSTAAPVLLMFIVIRRVGATRGSLLAFFIPVAAVILGVVILKETLPLTAILGFVMIIGGAIWTSRASKG